MSEEQIRSIIQYLMSDYPTSHGVADVSASTGVDVVAASAILDGLVKNDLAITEQVLVLVDQKLYELLTKRIDSIERAIGAVRKQRKMSSGTRAYLASLRDRLDKMTEERDALIKPVQFYTLVVRFKHWTVVGTADTADKYNELRVSCTLDYSVLIVLEKYYYMQAVYKISDWFTEMFNAREIKFSSEESETLEEMIGRITKLNREVTDIAYDWWWERSGASSNNEAKSGVISWEESIPLGAAGGWFTPGRKGKK